MGITRLLKGREEPRLSPFNQHDTQGAPAHLNPESVEEADLDPMFPVPLLSQGAAP